jgi:carbamoyltransferase
MSAYGTARFREAFDALIELRPGGFRLDRDFISYHTHGSSRWLSSAFVSRFGKPRQPGEPYEQRHFDVAYALQRTIEKAGVHLAQELYRLTKLPRLCLTGGVALNCLMNAKIIEEAPFKEVFIQPIANDAGTSLGSALYYYHAVLGRPREVTFDRVDYGPGYTDEAMRSALERHGLKYRCATDIAAEVAALLAGGRIVGWFQGRMECGPRALGNRTLAADPTNPLMKDRLNRSVKHREHFRPFAPSVLEEEVDDYFVMPKHQLSPYMIVTGRVRPERHVEIPAVVHVDGTARVHTVSRHINPRFWRVIAEFKKLKGVPIILNTSFNENEPIVCSPDDAVNCFLRTDFDALALGDYLVVKDPL